MANTNIIFLNTAIYFPPRTPLWALSSSSNKTTDLARQQWHKEKFEDFYNLSGDGPISEKDDEGREKKSSVSYKWIIVTETVVTVFPTITRIRITPTIQWSLMTKSVILSSSNPLSSPSYDFPLKESSNPVLDASLARSSVVFPGPSISIINPEEHLLSPSITRGDLKSTSAFDYWDIYSLGYLTSTLLEPSIQSSNNYEIEKQLSASASYISSSPKTRVQPSIVMSSSYEMENTPLLSSRLYSPSTPILLDNQTPKSVFSSKKTASQLDDDTVLLQPTPVILLAQSSALQQSRQTQLMLSSDCPQRDFQVIGKEYPVWDEYLIKSGEITQQNPNKCYEKIHFSIRGAVFSCA